MQKLIKSYWILDPGKSFSSAKILHHRTHPEGLDLERIRFLKQGTLPLNPHVGHILSVHKGNAGLELSGKVQEEYQLCCGVHLYLPPGQSCRLVAEGGTEFLHLSSPDADQARGTQVLLRDEMFLAASTCATHPLRWCFQPYFLSRLIFLYHDETLLSKSGTPVSWSRTTMFDAEGLPENDEGEPVFKMSYNSRTELNVCCDLQGEARVRMAKHPYREDGQSWGPWLELDQECSYHLNEATGSREEEWRIDDETESLRFYRNKHEVRISQGYLTLFSLFDPGPTGIITVLNGSYREEGPLCQVLGTRVYDDHLRELSRFDEMTHQLSLAKAKGLLGLHQGSGMWDLYLEGRKAQIDHEERMLRRLAPDHPRRNLLGKWMQQRMPAPESQPQSTGPAAEISSPSETEELTARDNQPL